MNDNEKHGNVIYFNGRDVCTDSSILAADKAALVDDLNRISGPPSEAMSLLQREFKENRMEPEEAHAFAEVCVRLLSEAIAISHPIASKEAFLHTHDVMTSIDLFTENGVSENTGGHHTDFPFFTKYLEQSEKIELSSLRRALVNRYNEEVGTPGPNVSNLQDRFLQGQLNPIVERRFIQQCEEMIEARQSLRRRRG